MMIKVRYSFFVDRFHFPLMWKYGLIDRKIKTNTMPIIIQYLAKPLLKAFRKFDLKSNQATLIF